MKTRDKIVTASLRLFNELGERKVTTNHIAAHIRISPGNLYYHFRNKEEIILNIYLELEGELLRILELPKAGRVSFEDVLRYIRQLFEHLWKYRFFYRDLVSLLDRVTALNKKFPRLIDRTLANGRAIYGSMVKANLMRATRQEIDVLTRNSWIVLSYWFNFLHIYGHRRNLRAQHIRQGIRQLVGLFYPYLEDAQKTRMGALLNGKGLMNVGQLVAKHSVRRKKGRN